MPTSSSRSTQLTNKLWLKATMILVSEPVGYEITQWQTHYVIRLSSMFFVQLPVQPHCCSTESTVLLFRTQTWIPSGTPMSDFVRFCSARQNFCWIFGAHARIFCRAQCARFHYWPIPNFNSSQTVMLTLAIFNIRWHFLYGTLVVV